LNGLRLISSVTFCIVSRRSMIEWPSSPTVSHFIAGRRDRQGHLNAADAERQWRMV
jgi:hypothetical protein